MNDIIIDDTCFSREEADQIGKNFVHSIPWYYNDKTVDKYKDQVFHSKNTEDLSQLTHLFYRGGEPKSEFYPNALKIMHEFMDNNNLDYKAIIRIKANLILKKSIDENKNTFPHIDTDFEHNVLLYYLNNSDGDTIFFNEKMEVEKNINPVCGRGVIFNGMTPHANKYPIKSEYRAVINFVYIPR